MRSGVAFYPRDWGRSHPTPVRRKRDAGSPPAALRRPHPSAPPGPGAQLSHCHVTLLGSRPRSHSGGRWWRVRVLSEQPPAGEAGTVRPPSSFPICPRVSPDFFCPLLSLCLSASAVCLPLLVSGPLLPVCLSVCSSGNTATDTWPPALDPAQLLGRVDATRTVDGPRSALWPVMVKTKDATWQDLCTVPREQDLRWL